MKGGKKKGKKKGKKEKGEEVEDEQDIIEKEMLQILMEELQQEVNFLQKQVEQLEHSNQDFADRYHKLDEDRADVISYLNRMVQEKSDEIAELQERVEGLQKARQQESESFEKRIVVLEHEAKVTQEQLTSEIKLLSGKLNALEEFRIQREELMQKFKQQEKQMEEQELTHKKMLYEIERKFIIRRDRLKKEMEASLQELSSQFRNTTLKQISANTQRTIRENIAINKELDILLNHTFESSKATAKLLQAQQNTNLQLKSAEFERRAALSKSNKLVKDLSKLKNDVERLKLKENELHETKEWACTLETSMDAAEARLEGAAHVVRRLRTEVRLRDAKIKMQSRLAQQEQAKCKKMERILQEAVKCIRTTLGIDGPTHDYQLEPRDKESIMEGEHQIQRASLLFHLLKLLEMAEEVKHTDREENDVNGCCKDMIGYIAGDLGLIRKEYSLSEELPIETEDILLHTK